MDKPCSLSLVRLRHMFHGTAPVEERFSANGSAAGMNNRKRSFSWLLFVSLRPEQAFRKLATYQQQAAAEPSGCHRSLRNMGCFRTQPDP